MGLRHRHQLELVVLAVTVIGLSRLLDGPLVWLVAGLLLTAVWLGGRAVLFEGAPRPAPVPLEATIIPAIVAVGSLGSLRLVALGLALVPALVGAGLLLDVALRLETRVFDRPGGMTPVDRTSLLGTALVASFLAFIGAASMVSGGIVEPGPGATELGPPITESGIVAVALADAFVAALLGYRFAIERLAGMGDAVWAAGTYGASIAITAGILRAVETPRLVFPALLTLVFYLWDTVRGTAPALRRDPRFLWQSILLAALAVAVVAWNLGLRGT